MKQVIYFLFVWLLIGALLGSIGFGVISVIDHVPVKEVIKTYDQKLSYILIFQCVSLISSIITILIFLREEQLGILDVGLKLKYPWSILWGFLFGALPIFITAIILIIINQIRIGGNSSNLFGIITYLFVFIVGSVNEEIVTRGYILRYLLLQKKKYAALILSSLLFALFHITNDNLTAISFLNIFLSGFFLGLFYVYFKNLWFSIAAHFAWNFFQGPVLGSSVSGLKTESIFKQTLIGNNLLTGGAFGFEASIICTCLLLLFIFLLYFWCENRLLISELNEP